MGIVADPVKPQEFRDCWRIAEPESPDALHRIVRSQHRVIASVPHAPGDAYDEMALRLIAAAPELFGLLVYAIENTDPEAIQANDQVESWIRQARELVERVSGEMS